MNGLVKEYMERIAKVPPGESLYKTYADAFKRQYLGKPSMTVQRKSWWYSYSSLSQSV